MSRALTLPPPHRPDPEKTTVLRIAVPNKGSLSEPATTMLKEAGYRTRRTGQIGRAHV